MAMHPPADPRPESVLETGARLLDSSRRLLEELDGITIDLDAGTAAEQPS